MKAPTNDVDQFQNQTEVLSQEPSSSLPAGRVATSTSKSKKSLSMYSQYKGDRSSQQQKQQTVESTTRSEEACYSSGTQSHIRLKCKYKDIVCTNYKIRNIKKSM